jgi:hypothetical protein
MDCKKEMKEQLDINSKDLYIKYLIDIIESNGLSYTSLSQTPDIDDLMSATCSLYNRLKRNKVMYLLEERDDIICIEEENEEQEEDEEIVKAEYVYEEPYLKDIELKLEPLLENFRTIRTYRTVLRNLCNNRIKVLGDVYVKSYTDLLMKHIQCILAICEEKKYPKKKTAECFELSLTGMDFRLLAYQSPRRDGEIQEYIVSKVSTKPLEVEDLVYLKTGLEKTQYRGTNLQKIIKNFFNYGTAVITMKELFQMYINSSSRIIYLADTGDIEEEVNKDPFRFYCLSRETNKKRYWEMDCRLDDFLRSFIKNVGLYLVDLFRRIYSDIFNDNTYRANFVTTSIMTNDCEQLLKNLCILCRYSAISYMMRDYVKKNFSYEEMGRDVFVLRSDDVLMKEDLKERSAEVDYGLIMMLFDNLELEGASNIFSTYDDAVIY